MFRRFELVMKKSGSNVPLFFKTKCVPGKQQDRLSNENRENFNQLKFVQKESFEIEKCPQIA